MPRSVALKVITLSCLLLSCATLTALGKSRAQSVGSESTADIRIARLAGLGKAWGAIKFFHPRLARDGIDWDHALVDTIPKVNAARSPQDYAAALNTMLAVLDDPSTHVQLSGEDRPTISPTIATSVTTPVRLESGVLTIDVHAVERTGYQEDKLQAFAKQAGALVAKAKIVVLDLRAEPSTDESTRYAREWFLSVLFPEILDRRLVLPAQRYRIQHGYAPQRGVSSGGFYSGWVTRTPLVLKGNSKTRTPPIILLINAHSTSTDAIAGLQAAGMAYVVQEGAPPATGDSATISLGDGAVLSMATTELVAPEGAVGFLAGQVVPIGGVPSAEQIMLTWKEEKNPSRSVSSASQTASDGKDNSYPEMRFPAYEYRLLALFRYWNVINYFFPYKNLIGSDWNHVLPRYIARLESNRSALDYETTLRELSVETHDRHAYMGPTLAFFEKVGAFIPPVVLRFVDGQWMVSAVLDSKAPMRIGDVVLRIDGKSASSRQEFFARMYPASTPQAEAVAVGPYLLRGQKNSMARLTVRGINGGFREVEMRRSLDYFTPVPPERITPAVAILPSGAGYVDLTRLQSSDVDSMFETIKNTSGTIFDMRGYPNGTARAIAPRLSKTRNLVSALFSVPSIEGVAIGDGGHGEATYQFEDRLPDAKGAYYDGRVVVLIDERAVSQAEHTCLMFEAATDVTFIGTPTSGTDGDATNLVLPGGITANFSGDSVRHADGRQLQRIGIQPTIRVAPTIAGLAAGRDEVLEAAVAFLAKQSASKAH